MEEGSSVVVRKKHRSEVLPTERQIQVSFSMLPYQIH